MENSVPLAEGGPGLDTDKGGHNIKSGQVLHYNGIPYAPTAYVQFAKEDSLIFEPTNNEKFNAT